MTALVEAVDPDQDQSLMADYATAMLNILDDLTEEKQRMSETHLAVLNMLEDFDEEAKRRRRAEAEVREANATLETRVRERTLSLEQANRDLESFSYSVSHDLRTPLRAIDGFSLILLEDYAGKLDSEGERILNVIRDGTEKMSRMIDDILQFSRAGRSEIVSAPVDMASLVRTAIEDLRPAMAGRNVHFEVGVLPPVYGDAATLQRVWTNLLDNAVKYSAPRAEACIVIGATAGAGETVYFVRDNGVGFDMKFADKLFGVFQRLHGSEFTGTGIGLAIVKRIVNRHGGRVWAESAPNTGTTFHFALPGLESLYGHVQPTSQQ